MHAHAKSSWLEKSWLGYNWLTNAFFCSIVSKPGHEAVNALLGPMPAKKAPSAGAMAAPTSMGYIKYGNGMFDGQGSGHDFYGNLYAPSIGWRNSTDGGRSILFPDYRQA